MKILCLIIILLFGNSVFSHKHEEIPRVISKEVKNLRNSKPVSSNLTKALTRLHHISDKETSNKIFCQTCNVVMHQIISYRKSGASKESIQSFLQTLCKTFTDWGSIACDGYVNIEIDTILYIIDNKKDLTPERVCGISFQTKSCYDPNKSHWKIAIPPRRVHHLQEAIHHKANPWKILHLTDFHYDPLYKPGSNAKCNVPLCCQESNGQPVKNEDAAGYWGDYHACDMPWHTITDFVKQLKSNYTKFDYIYYTGDIISHKSWATTKDHNTEAIKELYKLFNDTFNGTAIFPILGNHEPHPTDFFSPGNVTEKVSTQWIFDLSAQEWARWLPNSTITTIRAGGYYTVSVKPGFRIIALNSNVCYTNNLWLFYNDDDPYDQLKWLVEVLTEAEKNREKVHILSHIPPGEVACLQNWGYQFKKIINRFAPIITAQFNGHTHLDELRLFYDMKNPKKIINVAFNAGSFTTFVGLNPNYRIYDVDPNNYDVLDYDQFTFNLTEANANPKKSPRWYKLYSFKEAYGLENTSLSSLDDLVTRMSKNSSLLSNYYKYQVRESAPEMAKGCDKKCQNILLCKITAIDAESSMRCDNQ